MFNDDLNAGIEYYTSCGYSEDEAHFRAKIDYLGNLEEAIEADDYTYSVANGRVTKNITPVRELTLREQFTTGVIDEPTFRERLASQIRLELEKAVEHDLRQELLPKALQQAKQDADDTVREQIRKELLATMTNAINCV